MRAHTLLLAALVAAGAGRAGAQAPGSCELGRAEADLDVGGVRAKVFNAGNLFFRDEIWAAYEVPRGSGRSPLFAAGLWVGGVVDGELRMAGATYGDFEFWPGPLDPATGRPPDPSDCSAYDRIWRVSRYDVAEYYRTGVASPDLAEWPHALGAPVIDGDGDPTNYDLAGGDQPAISGDQMLWWVMNDVGNEHRITGAPPMGLEVRVEAFAFGGGPIHLTHATFYRYTFVYHSSRPIENAVYALWVDPDLGSATDDYVAVDTSLGLGIAYNADNKDGQGAPPSYGESPPALGVDLLSTGAGAFRYLIEIPHPYGDPNGGPAMYHAMQGRWNDGTPVRMGGLGDWPPTAPITTFHFPGDPVTGRFWSERCPSAPACGSAITPGDRRFLISAPLSLVPAVAQSHVVALLHGQADDNLDSITELRRASTYAQNAHDAGLLTAQRVPGWPGPPPPPKAIELRRPAPNPFSDEAVMSITLPAAAGVRVALVDVLGREVQVVRDGPLDAGAHAITLPGAGLAPGVYIARVWVAGQSAGALPVTRR